jgi:glutamate synthase (NADPH/NADH) large chain
VRKWRLQPGKMFLIDLEQGRMIDDDELKANIVNTKPYKQWIENLRIKLDSIEAGEVHRRPHPRLPELPLLDRQQAFGYTQEDIKFLMAPMARNGEEGIGSMGNDSPLAVLSGRNKPLYNYFKQLFAQVTNPPIDPIREAIVMSLNSFIGPKPNLLDINQVNPPMRLEVSQPVLNFADMAKLRDIERHTQGKFRSAVIDITYPLAWGREGVEAKLASLCAQAVDAIKGGANILIISDRGVGATQVAIPALLALVGHPPASGARRLAHHAGLVVETGTAREVHHFAVLAGYGAEAVHPYLAMETLADMHKDLGGDLSADKAIYNYVKAIGKGLSKIMSKMGVSTYMSYCGAQLFEAIGLNSATVGKYFTGTASRVEGIGVFEIAEEAIRMHKAAFGDDPVLETMLDAGGRIRLAHPWRRAHVDARRHRQAAAQHALQQLEHLQGIRPDHQRPEQAPHDAARPVRVQVRPLQGHPLGRGRARQGHRQALCHGRHVAGLHFHRGPRHPGRGHEPHRRQEQHGRGR